MMKSGYLDKYSIAESIKDGTTVTLNYALAPSSLLVDRELLEKKFLNLAEAEGVSDVEELNAILDRAVELKEMMKASSRIEKIAEYAAMHFKENVEPMGFKAFFVAVDREACALYKKALDKHLPADYSRVVYSPCARRQGNPARVLSERRRGEESPQGIHSQEREAEDSHRHGKAADWFRRARFCTACTSTSRCATTSCFRPSLA